MKIEGADDDGNVTIADIHAGKRLRKVEAPRALEGLQVGCVLDAADAAAAESRVADAEGLARRDARSARAAVQARQRERSSMRKARRGVGGRRSSAAARPRRSPPETRGSAPLRDRPPRAPRPSTPSR